MRILITSDTALPAIGGAEMHVEYMRRALEALGCETMVFTTQGGPEQRGVKRHPWDRDFVSLYRDLERHVDDFQPDLIATHYAYRLSMVAGLIGRLRKIPVTVTLHGLGILPPASPSFRGALQHAFYRRVSLAFATKVISTSEDLAITARKYVSSKKLVVIPNGAASARFSRDRLEKDPRAAELRERFAGRKVILSVRRLNPKCGIQYLVEALPSIIEKHPELLYVMIGTGRLEDAIRSRISELGLEKHVLMTGSLENAQVAPYFAAADLVVFPSTAESTSIACIEAMMAGCPVVASRVGGLIELLGSQEERGRLVHIVGDEHSDYHAPEIVDLPDGATLRLSDAISDLLSDRVRQERYRTAAFEYAIAHYDWAVLARETLEVFKKIVG